MGASCLAICFEGALRLVLKPKLEASSKGLSQIGPTKRMGPLEYLTFKTIPTISFPQIGGFH